jgi:hypothetical protein
MRDYASSNCHGKSEDLSRYPPWVDYARQDRSGLARASNPGPVTRPDRADSRPGDFLTATRAFATPPKGVSVEWLGMSSAPTTAAHSSCCQLTLEAMV